MKNKKLFLIISLGIVLIASAIVVTMLLTQKTSGSITVSFADSTLTPSTAPSEEPEQLMEQEESLPAVPKPILYTKDGRCYLAYGSNSICLGVYKNPAGITIFPESVSSGNKRYLFYLDEFDVYKGYGTLKRVSADAQSEPITVAENICAAVPSDGGARAMYIAEIKDGCGRLYLWDEKKGVQFVSNNVIPELFEFSPHSNCISYLVKEDSSNTAMYVKKNNKPPSFVIRQGIGPDDNGGVGLQCFGGVSIGDQGEVLYLLWIWEGEDTGNHLYLYSEGKTEQISQAERILNFDGSTGSLLYAESFIGAGRLMYKEKGKEPVVLSDDFESGQLPDDYKPGEGMSFIVQKAKDNSGITNDLYESNGKGKVLIAASDGYTMMNAEFTCVAYERNGAFYTSRKTDKGWEEKRLCAVTYDEGDNSSVESEFDTSGNYLYYYDSENDGSLYRYSTADGNVKKIVNNARRLYVFGDTPYVINSKGNAYRVNGDGSIIQIGKEVKEIYETYGGVYLTDEESGGNIYFAANEKSQIQLVDSSEYVCGVGGQIDYRLPLGEGKYEAAEILYNDCDHYLGELEGYNGNSPYLTVEEDIALTEKLIGRTDLEPEETDFLIKMLKSFRLYEQYEAGNKDKKAEAGNALTAATDAYKSYVYGLTEDDINNEDE